MKCDMERLLKSVVVWGMGVMIALPALKGQDLSRLRVEPFAEELEVSYTLKADRPLEVQLYYSEDDGYNWVGPLTSVTGDVGSSVAAGKNKKKALV